MVEENKINNSQNDSEEDVEIENNMEHKKKWADAFKSKNPENDEMIRLQEENADLKDKLLRARAETENTRRIAIEEKEKTIKFAITNFAKDLIVIMENMYLAFKSVENTDKEGEFKVFFDGVNLTFSELKKVFEKNNIKRIYPKGEKFDPAYHEAISQIESEAEESGTVIDVVQAGYMLNGRVIKAAMVVVAK